MIALKYLLAILGIGLFGSAGALVVYDVYVSSQLRRLLRRSGEEGAGAGETTFLPARPFGPVRWQRALLLAALAVMPLLISQSIVVVPDGYAGVRVSQFWGARPGTIYPGVHLVMPFVDYVARYDTREQVYTTAAAEIGKNAKELLTVQAREGLNIGIAVAVRYRIDPRPYHIHANLPGNGGRIGRAGRCVHLSFARAEPSLMKSCGETRARSKAADAIKTRLETDGILVREVVLRDIKLPEEYAKGLEGLLLKEQESERLGTEQEIKQKEVKIAELEAEAQKARDVKRAEAQAQVRVRTTKAGSDSCSHCYWQKQIGQSSSTEARKEATLQTPKPPRKPRSSTAGEISGREILRRRGQPDRRRR
jgi:regulator of protease activity HflC (stomatin/prohibitin superfamily)